MNILNRYPTYMAVGNRKMGTQALKCAGLLDLTPQLIKGMHWWGGTVLCVKYCLDDYPHMSLNSGTDRFKEEINSLLFSWAYMIVIYVRWSIAHKLSKEILPPSGRSPDSKVRSGLQGITILSVCDVIVPLAVKECFLSLCLIFQDERWKCWHWKQCQH